MNTRTLFFLLPLFIATGLTAQSTSLSEKDREEMSEVAGRMSDLITTVYTDSSEVARFTACRDLIRELVTALDRPNSFRYDFSGLQGLSVQYPADSTFRIFSWELNVSRDEYRHYGAIQMNTESLSLVPLLDRGADWLENPENAIVGADNWLGYAVYRIIDGGTYEGRPYYFLLGYDSYEAYRRRKILDVLRFDKAGKPIFGLPVFETYTDSELLLSDRARIILEYGAEATVALRYDKELGGIVYENLIMVPGNYGEGPVNMPDGSYHLLTVSPEGIWREEEQLFNHKYEEAPREAAKPDEGLDLIGRSRKGGGR
ncbi:hypothetical protein GGR28_001119 [Lewinella aquimaris]|uniref:Uncharacterized protein n=1 Tax=Neolewinella aquimaris TaxID=1835722 RepID=A0A840EC02_9BACT|nr:hypothetical protein [Neolewinella aquimaris]MBB4078506.1 hypothetical protein [Neolewinella aquimaris]